MEKKDLINFLEENNFPTIKAIFETVEYTPMTIEVIPTGLRMDFLIEEDDKVLTLEFINNTVMADVFMSKSDLKNRDYVVTALDKKEVVNAIKSFFNKDYEGFENMIAQNKREYNPKPEAIRSIEAIMSRDGVIKQASTLVHCFNEHGRVLFAVLQNNIPFIVTLDERCLVNIYALVSKEQFTKCEKSVDVPYNGKITYHKPYDNHEESRAKFQEAFKQYLNIDLDSNYNYVIGWDFFHINDYYDENFLEDLDNIGKASGIILNKDILLLRRRDDMYNKIRIDWDYIREFILEISNTMR